MLKMKKINNDDFLLQVIILQRLHFNNPSTQNIFMN